MKFLMMIEAQKPLPRTYIEEGSRNDKGVNDAICLIIDACQALASTSRIKFIVLGFDTKPWLVDVKTDLALVLEQLPYAIESLQEKKDFSIDFPEQGVERRLDFQRKGDEVEIECVSGHHRWEPQPEAMFIKCEELKLMLQDLARDFSALVGDVCPRIAEHPWFQDWKKSVLGW